MPVIILVADGARPDTLAAAMDRGELPALTRLRAEGGAHTIVTAWPSVTGVAYTPFLMGRYPGPVGLPGLRWFDRSRRISGLFGHSRSYVGSEMRQVDGDLATEAPTMFELTSPRLGALAVIHRGLPWRSRLGFGARFVARAAVTHFRGNVRGWLAIDRDIGSTLARRIRRERPEFVFAALTGIDKTSHSEGHDSTVVREAMQIVDGTVAEIRHDAERAGTWEHTHVWVVSDHGHSPVRFHDDLAELFRGNGFRTLAHPWTFGNSHQIAVMVSGNAMAHLYLDLSRRDRPFWPQLAGKWGEQIDALTSRPSVDLVVLPLSPSRCEVRGNGRGAAIIVAEGGRYSYHPETGDPLGIGDVALVDATDAFDATWQSDYPDGVVQIAHLAASPRCGEVLLSAARQWDFRERYEPIPHVSSHGALHREHMLVPLVTSQPASRVPRRTVDVMPSALQALGRAIPPGLDGASFL
ncbi:MAG: alkaline phosphatase family protein [Gemmatimonadaceae bacterium]|nr:alkaline phosphatase family protein [Gemmatimonadaceae bacterium]